MKQVSCIRMTVRFEFDCSVKLLYLHIFYSVRVRIELTGIYESWTICFVQLTSRASGVCDLSDASNVRFQSPGPNIWTVNARHSTRQSRDPESQTSDANLELRFPNFEPRSIGLHPVPTSAEHDLSLALSSAGAFPSTLARTKLITSACVHSGALADVPEDGLIRNYPARGWTCRGSTNATKFAKAISEAATRHDERTRGAGCLY